MMIMMTREPGSSEIAASVCEFALRSVVREYGWRFAWRIAVRHPWRTLNAFREADRIDVTGSGVVDVNRGTPAFRAGDTPSIVGAGFCLKPISPPCPSGRANHDCLFLEELPASEAADLPEPCRSCAIREIGTQSLRAGSAFYVMTSARDILDDVFVPAMARRTFRTGLFVLCRYSFQPFVFGMRSSGLSGRLIPLAQGDCRDFRTWLLADRGIKLEQTTVDGSGMAGVASLLGRAAPSQSPTVERRGNVLYPAMAGPSA
jgi:hypothetical protein